MGESVCGWKREEGIKQYGEKRDRQRASGQYGRYAAIPAHLLDHPYVTLPNGMNAAKLIEFEEGYQEITGEEPAPGKHYDIKVIFDEEYLNDPYIGSYIEDSDGNTKFIPHTQGVQIILTESGGFSKPKKIDITGSFSKNM